MLRGANTGMARTRHGGGHAKHGIAWRVPGLAECGSQQRPRKASGQLAGPGTRPVLLLFHLCAAGRAMTQMRDRTCRHVRAVDCVSAVASAVCRAGASASCCDAAAATSESYGAQSCFLLAPERIAAILCIAACLVTHNVF